MKRQFNILACRDVSKSEFSEAEKQRAAQISIAGGRTLLLDQDENATSSNNSNNNNSNYTFSSKKCLKLVLQPLFQESNLPELLTAFEFAGSLTLGGTVVDAEGLEGKVLEVDSDHLDLMRGVLLLDANQCQILETSMIPDEFFLEDDFI